MNIDERLEKLAERHEALTQTVELLSRDIHDLYVMQQNLYDTQQNNERKFYKTDQRIGEVMEGIGRLLRVAESTNGA